MSMKFTRRPGQKVYLSDDKTFGFGLAGDESSMQGLKTAIASTHLHGEVESVRKRLQDVAGNVLVPQYEAVRTALGPGANLPAAEAIVGGYCEGLPQLFYIDARTLVTNLVEGFASNGVGKTFADHAEVTFRQLREGGLTWYQCEMLCFRVIESAVEVGGPEMMLGGPVQVATVRLVNGTPRAERRPDDDPALKDAVDTWVALEAERFRQHQPGG